MNHQVGIDSFRLLCFIGHSEIDPQPTLFRAFRGSDLETYSTGSLAAMLYNSLIVSSLNIRCSRPRNWVFTVCVANRCAILCKFMLAVDVINSFAIL